MNILILNGSPRPKGSTAAMIQAFSESAEVHHNIAVINVCQKKIAGCLACEYCHTKGNGTCIQKDDMQEIYYLLKDTEMLVIASPIYYHGISGQLKCTIDRFYAAAYPRKSMKLSKIAMFLSSGDPSMYDGAIFSYQGDFLDYLGLQDMGIFTSHGSQNQSPEKLQELRNFGASL
ncbi:MAG: flavodoxin family protein [Oscillospiraceae bacterium]|nr:flavodoxin family protein [Oscillospiraceae bacterium]